MLSTASRIVSRSSRVATAHAAGATSHSRPMGTIAKGVEFDTIAREWRCKWSDDNDKKSLQEAQKALMGVADDLKGTTGCKSVFRVVCGGNKDFKVITSVSAADFKLWADAGFPPEASFLEKLGAIDGIHTIETQTYTIMPV